MLFRQYYLVQILTFLDQFCHFVIHIYYSSMRSLGMKDSWGPLKALVVVTVINGIGDIVLCRVFSYGIAGAAWATLVSQVNHSFVPSPLSSLNVFDVFFIPLSHLSPFSHILK